MNRRCSSCLLLLVAALVLPCCTGKAGDDKEVRAFLERYFATWSAQDMDGYGASFDDQARITFVGQGGRSESMGLTDFLHSQRMAHQVSPVRMKEVPLEMKITPGKSITQAAVSWKLSKGDATETGTDYFTLVRGASGWHIVALAFDQD